MPSPNAGATDHMTRPPRLLLLVVAAVVVAVGLFSGVPSTAAAQNPPTTVLPLPPEEQQKPSIIPLPNSGHEPVVEGDPGSAAQYAVLFGTMGGMVAIALLVLRESRRKRDQQTPKPGEPAEAPEKVAT